MMKALILIMLLTGLSFNAFSYVFSQNKDFSKKETRLEIKDAPENFHTQSAKVIMLEKKMLHAKESGDINEMGILQAELDMLTGSITLPGVSMNLEVDGAYSHPPFQTDNINVSRVVSLSGLKAVSVSTEQRGSTESKIWTVFAYESGAADAMGVYFSEDNGISWGEYGSAIMFSNGNRINIDEIDSEIIEDTTGDKYLWIVFGYTNSGGQKLVGVNIVKITNGFQVAGYTLNWPGSNSNSRYYKPRICTDNAEFPSAPWVYIVACYDSTSAIPPLRGYSGKTVRCNAPFTLTPAFTYKPEPLVTPNLRLNADVYYDIAYFRNVADDSVAFVATGYADTSSVVIHSSSIVSFTSSISTIGTIQPNNRRRSHGYIASNGGYNKLMIVSRTKYNEDDWDIEYFVSASGSNVWSGGNIDFRNSNSGRPDIKEKWNSPGTFYCAYSNISTVFDSVSTAICNNYIWGTPVTPVNHIDASVTTNPRPGLRYVQGDSSLVIWSENTGTGTHLWASGGSAGNIVSLGTTSSEIPGAFELSQNYPNPFNPSTSIQFKVKSSKYVELKVFDINGREVAALVNNELQPGTYEYTFDGSGLSSGMYLYRLRTENFSETRRMILIK